MLGKVCPIVNDKRLINPKEVSKITNKIKLRAKNINLEKMNSKNQHQRNQSINSMKMRRQTFLQKRNLKKRKRHLDYEEKHTNDKNAST